MKPETPKVSVIIPFYNAESTLERSLESIGQQTMTNFECILINNNSTDRSREIANSWCSIDSRFFLIDEEKQGVMYASNSGSLVARADYIARMDADDWAYPDRLLLQSEFLDSNMDYGAVSGMVVHIGEKAKTKGFARYVDWVNSVKSYQEILKSRFIESPIVNPSAMWRREIGDIYGMYRSGDFPEDYEMWLRWLSKGVKISKLDSKVLKWYDSESRLTRTDSIYSDSAFYRIKAGFLAEWLKERNPHHPHVLAWGASRISRRRASLLKQYGVEIDSYVDIRRNRQLDKKVLYYSEIPPPEEAFILTYIKQRDARDMIKDFLHSRGYIEGVNYLLVS